MVRDSAGDVLLLGIDAGASKTEAVLVSCEGQVVARGRGGPSNHRSGPDGYLRLSTALSHALAPIVSQVGKAAVHIYAGLSGLSIPDKEQNFRSVLANLLTPASISCSDDAEIALEGATAGGPGIVVIAGTGSIVLGRTADGRTARAGGYGYLFGDEGSGFDLGRRAIIAVLQAADGRAPSTSLGERLREMLGMEDVRLIPGYLYGTGKEVEIVAGLAPVVLKAAGEGDATAHKIICEAASSLADLVRAVAKYLGVDLPVYMAGSLLLRSELYRREFETALSAVHPLVCRTPKLSPVGGAVLSAARRAGVPIDSDFLERLIEGLHAS